MYSTTFDIHVEFVRNNTMYVLLPQEYPLTPDVLKFEYVKPQNFKYGTTVEWVSKVGHS